jgi:hypothetical protein
MIIHDSKEAIYKDFAIALKFGLDHPVYISAYEDLFKVLARDSRVKLTQSHARLPTLGLNIPFPPDFSSRWRWRATQGRRSGLGLFFLA